MAHLVISRRTSQRASASGVRGLRIVTIVHQAGQLRWLVASLVHNRTIYAILSPYFPYFRTQGVRGKQQTCLLRQIENAGKICKANGSAYVRRRTVYVSEYLSSGSVLAVRKRSA